MKTDKLVGVICAKVKNGHLNSLDILEFEISLRFDELKIKSICCL